MEAKQTIRVALVGNPNSGKSSLFNSLTGDNQHIGNWPGVTVARAEGDATYNGAHIRFVDLPGTYSLNTYSPEEKITRNYLVAEKPDVIINIVDASNLRSQLYLTTQLAELSVPVVLVLNKIDLAEKLGITIDHQQLTKVLGFFCVPASAVLGRGIEDILQAIVHSQSSRELQLLIDLPYSPLLSGWINRLSTEISRVPDLTHRLPLPYNYIAARVLEEDPETLLRLDLSDRIKNQLLQAREELTQSSTQTVVEQIATVRYQWVDKLLTTAMTRSAPTTGNLSDRIDTIITHRFLGIPIFAFVMWGVFQLTFRLGEQPMRWIEALFSMAGDFARTVIPWPNVASLVADGIIAGVGGVLLFLPNIIFLFAFLAILEECGYMARAALVMEKLMQLIGLHGKAFIPMIMGFGCSVPAFMSARILKNDKERIATMLVTPFVSCSAKFPVYVLIIGAFFPSGLAGTILFGVYILGIVLALLIARILRSTVLKGKREMLIMELPSYRWPAPDIMLKQVLNRCWMYVRRAGTVILLISALLWILMSYPKLPAEKINSQYCQSALEYSFAGRIGRLMEPVIKPLGYDWKIGVALLAGFSAKEVIVSTLGSLYSIDGSSEDTVALGKAIRDDPNWSPLKAIGFLLFVIIYVPCFASVIVFNSEVFRKRWTVFLVVYTTTLAWLAAFGVYQVGTWLGY